MSFFNLIPVVNNNAFELDMDQYNPDVLNRANAYIRRYENHLIDAGNGMMVADDEVPRVVNRIRINPDEYDITALDAAARYVSRYQGNNNNGGRGRRSRGRRSRSRRSRSGSRRRQSKQRRSRK